MRRDPYSSIYPINDDIVTEPIKDDMRPSKDDIGSGSWVSTDTI